MSRSFNLPFWRTRSTACRSSEWPCLSLSHALVIGTRFGWFKFITSLRARNSLSALELYDRSMILSAKNLFVERSMVFQTSPNVPPPR